MTTDAFRLSPQQEGFLYHAVKDATPGLFLTQVVVDLGGAVETHRLRTAWARVIEAHPALRTIILWDGLDTPLQVVRDQADLPFDAGPLPDDMEVWLAADRARGIDLAKAPLMRVALLGRGDAPRRMVWTFHHILMDGWSTQIVLGDLFRAYEGAELAPAPSYRDFVEMALGLDPDAQARFWHPRVREVSLPTRIVDRLGRPASGHGLRETRLPRPESQALKDFAREQRITLNTLVLGAWARLLAIHSGEEEVIFGTTLSGRTGALPGIETTVGLCINTLPLRVRVDGPSLIDWLRDIQREQGQVQDHELTPLVDIQRESGLPPGTGLFDTIVVFENVPDLAGPGGAGLTVTGVDYRDQSNFALALVVLPGDEIALRLVHDRSYWSDAGADALLGQLRAILTRFVAAPGTAPGDHGAGVAAVPEPGEVPGTPPLCHLISTHATDRGDAPAVIRGGVSTDYANLEAKARGIAGALVARGTSPGDHVGLFARRGADHVAGVLGILKAGAAFVPLDPDYPADHHTSVCASVPMTAILAEDAETEAAAALGPPVLPLSRTGDPLDDDRAQPDAAAYVIHTSGSQGTRKGVVVSHRNLTYSTLARRTVYDTPPARFLLLSPVAFDSAMAGFFWTLAEGGTLVLPEPGEERDAEAIAALIAREGVTHTLAIPSLWSLILDAARPGQLESLATVAVAGEACPPDLVIRHHDALPEVALVNEYGPTEATVWCIAARLTPASVPDGQVPIGRAIPGTAAHILDRFGQPVPDGVAGELFISGPGVAKGYLGRPDLTGDRFLPDPFLPGQQMYRTGDLAWRRPDGIIVYAGRSDDQLKIRGFRVEPGEIAAALTAHPDIAEAAIVLRPELGTADLARALGEMGDGAASALLSEIEAVDHDGVANR